MWGISILVDFRPMIFFGLGKHLLFKSVLGHCGERKNQDGFTFATQVFETEIG